MKKNILTPALMTLALASLPLAASAQMTLADKGKPKAQIRLVEDNSHNREAAELLQRFVRELSGAQLPIISDGKTGKGSILIGGTTHEASHDGFSITCKDGVLQIKGAGGKGVIYGVTALLENYLGVNYYAKDYYVLNRHNSSATLSLPEIHMAETPAFLFRQTFSYGNQDPVYANWFRTHDQSEMFINNMWVHTFDRLMPASVYGKDHPEYYSYINGERRPGNHSQWCLTNPEVFEIVAGRLDSIFKANPDKDMISVSQNDGNDTYCQCEECKKVMDYEGSPSGPIIRFMNKLATRFPDKQFSTLAYLFSMTPPKHVKPLPNVNIMLCDIDCKREVPLTDNASGQYFIKALEGWAAISNNIFVWDYGINFDNMVSPFPNFHILQKNIQLFKKNHATMLFEQVNGSFGTDFAELRAYMIEKLMWNPYLDADSLMTSFMQGYYGDAARYMYRYQQLLQGALLSSGTELWIYDSPVTHKNGMLNPQLTKTYDELFDAAEKAVAGDSARLAHVQISRLPLRYSKLEIARTMPDSDTETVVRDLMTFQNTCRRFGVTTLNERNNRVEDYCTLYRERFLPSATVNKAKGAEITWTSAPDDRYMPIADKALTDGLYGGTTYVESWVGWKGRDADFVIDMKESKHFSKVTIDFFHQLGAWIFLPKSVTCHYSDDNVTWTEMGRHEFAEDRDPSVKFTPAILSTPSEVKARYIKVHIETLGLCPSWHYGVGYPAWFFLDEMVVE